MSNVLFPVTAKKDGPQGSSNLATSKVVYLTENDLEAPIPNKTSGQGCVVKIGSAKKKIELRESALDLKTAMVEGVSTNPYTSDNADLAVSAAGSVLTAATDLTKYLNKITALTTGTADGVQLPAPSDRNIVVVVNSGSAALDVFPHSASAFIGSGASGAAYSVAVGERKHFYTDETGDTATWKVATDTGV